MEEENMGNPEKEQNKTGELNPEIRKVEVGKKELRPLSIYPLSAADQVKMSEFIAKCIKTIVDSDKLSDIGTVTLLLDLLKDNLSTVLSLICDKEELGEDILAEVTNKQIFDIGKNIYEVNYEFLIGSAKKVIDLFGGKDLLDLFPFPSEGSLQKSSDTTPNSDLETSTPTLIKRGG